MNRSNDVTYSSNSLPNGTRYHRLDGWRGYSVPAAAVAGVSDTGTWDDSPCPSGQVAAELRGLGRELSKRGIRWRTRYGTSSNVFCGKRWLCVRDRARYPEAAQLALDYIETNRRSTHFLHDADQEQLGYKASAEVSDA